MKEKSPSVGFRSNPLAVIICKTSPFQQLCPYIRESPSNAAAARLPAVVDTPDHLEEAVAHTGFVGVGRIGLVAAAAARTAPVAAVRTDSAVDVRVDTAAAAVRQEAAQAG